MSYYLTPALTAPRRPIGCASSFIASYGTLVSQTLGVVEDRLWSWTTAPWTLQRYVLWDEWLVRQRAYPSWHAQTDHPERLSTEANHKLCSERHEHLDSRRVKGFLYRLWVVVCCVQCLRMVWMRNLLRVGSWSNDSFSRTGIRPPLCTVLLHTSTCRPVCGGCLLLWTHSSVSLFYDAVTSLWLRLYDIVCANAQDQRLAPPNVTQNFKALRSGGALERNVRLL